MKQLFTIVLIAIGLSLSANAEPAKIDQNPLFGDLEFRNIGPFRGGRVTAVVGHADQPFTFYMGGVGGGVWKTTNAGTSWVNITDDYFHYGSVGAIDVAPSDTNLILVGMGESPFRGVASSHGDGLWLSRDAGKSWDHLGLEEARQVSSVKFHPENADVMLAAVQGSPWAPTQTRGVYRSTDGGQTWSRTLFENDTAGAVDLKYDPANPRIVYASLWDHERDAHAIRSGGSGSGIWKSTDFGATWTRLSDGLPEEMGKIGVAPSGAQPGLVFAIVEAKEKGGLYRSTDGGENWSHINGDRRLHARSWYYMHIFADPTDARHVIVLNAPFMESKDGGRSFSPVSVPHGDTHDLWINPKHPEIMINANDGGGTVTLDGGKSWSTIYNQPTQQFYRVNADNGFPYKVYGGQQDNSTVAILSRAPDGSIGAEDFHSVGGCESAHVAFDPENPRYVYAGCYLGLINEYDQQTETSRDIRAYPELAFGVPPKNRKYRFNWNAPIVVSAHDPSVIYHGGNQVLKSTDRGVSWEEISPDLTRDEEDRQGEGGAPITNEVSENYNTLMYLAEHPARAGELWAGSDDGLVHVTRDGGATWDNVTPRGVGRALINSIEISPHDPDRVTLAVTRYKENDHAPLIYVTSNSGRTWRQIASDTMDEFVRVVREDPLRDGLLYAGTENGLYLSFDGGRSWARHQLGLPRTPITDIKLANGDVIIATQGRGFWILDDPAPLRAHDPAQAQAALHLYAVSDVQLMQGTGGRNGGSAAPNPPSGAVIFYRLGEDFDLDTHSLTLKISDAEGAVIRTLKTDKKKGEKGGGGGSAYALPAQSGLNRAIWNLRADNLASVKGLWSIAGGADKVVDGPRVGPGTYQLELALSGGEEDEDIVQTASVTIVADPRFETDDRERQTLAAQAFAMVEELQDSVTRLRAVRDQAKAQAAHVKALEGDYAALTDAADALAKAVKDWEAGLINTKREFFQDVLNWPDKLHSDLQSIAGTLDGSVMGVTQGAKQRLEDLKGRFGDAMAARDEIISGALSAYNDAYKAADLPAVILAPPKAGE